MVLFRCCGFSSLLRPSMTLCPRLQAHFKMTKINSKSVGWHFVNKPLCCKLDLWCNYHRTKDYYYFYYTECHCYFIGMFPVGLALLKVVTIVSMNWHLLLFSCQKSRKYDMNESSVEVALLVLQAEFAVGFNEDMRQSWRYLSLRDKSKYFIPRCTVKVHLKHDRLGELYRELAGTVQQLHMN